MGSKDPFLTSLKSMGLSVVRLPRPALGPLTLLSKARGSTLSVIGRLDELVRSDRRVTVKRDQPAAGIDTTETRDLDAAVAITLLSGWLVGFGGKDVGLDLALKGAKTIRFSFPKVLIDSISGVELDKYLGAGEVDPAAKKYAGSLNAKQLYVITLAAKTNAFSMEVTSSTEGSLNLSAPAIQEVIGAGVSVKAIGAGKRILQYEGPKALYFGFQAVRLFYIDGAYQGFEPIASGKNAILGAEKRGPRNRERLSTSGPFTALSDPGGLDDKNWDDLVEIRRNR